MAFVRLHLALALALPLLLGSRASGGDLEDLRILVRQGAYAPAVEKLTPLATQGDEARLLLAEVYRRTGAYEEAVRLLAGRAGEAAVRSAEILRETGRRAEAEALLASLAPSPPVLVLQGELAALAGETEKAREAWESCIRHYEAMTPDDVARTTPELLIVFGRALVGLNRFEEANEVMLSQALELEGGRENVAALLFGGELFTSKYDFPEGRKYFRKARDLDRRNPDVLAWLAKAMLDDPMQGGMRLEEARALAREALAVNPQHERALILLGDTCFFDGGFEEALVYYRKACAANPTSLEALGAIHAVAHLTFNEPEKQKAEEAARAVSKKPAPFCVAAAKRCEIQCHYPVALALARQAHELDASYWPLFTPLVLGELRAGRYESGEKLAAEGFARDRYNVWLSNTNQLIRFWKTRYAEEPWDRLVFHAPKETIAFYVNYLGPLLAQASQLFSERYGYSPPATIHVEVYHDQQYFATRVLGLPDFPAQGVCFGNVIAVTSGNVLSGNHAVSTWHEFAHVFTVLASDYRVPRWLTEGISVREEGLCPAGGPRSSLSALGKAVAGRNVPTFSDFDRRFRRPRDIDELLTAYALAPFAADFLLERFGHGVLPRLLNSLKRQEFPAAFREVTGTELAAFDKAFVENLTRRGIAAAEQFAGSGVDEDALTAKAKAGAATPREIADLAWAYLGRNREVDAETMILKLRARNELEGEVNAMLGILALKNGQLSKAEPLFRRALEQGTRNAYNVLTNLAAIAAKRKDAKARADWLAETWKRFPDLAAEGGDHGPLMELSGLWRETRDPRRKQLLADLAARNRDATLCRAELAQILREEGDQKGEFALLSQLVFVLPFDRPNHLNTELFSRLAACAEALGLAVEAARARKVIEEKP
jgi:tetratricopeptide (TPR) repeat protein